MFIGSYFAVMAQSFTENDLKKMAHEINAQLKGTDLGNGITVRGCIAYSRTLVYQYDVDEFWYPPENMKEDLISNFKEAGNAKIFFNNDIDVDFHYYFGNKLQKRVSIKSNEFSNLNFDLGNFISIEGHPKAKGVNLKLKPPIDWKIEEGDRPNIVKKFVYENNSYMIIVKDNITFFSRNEVSELLEDDDYVNEFISDASSFLQYPEILNHDIVTIDKYPTLVFTMKGQMERSGIKMSLIFKNWIIFYEDKIVFLQCGGINNNEFYTLEGLFNLITNSVIFPEQYN
jgi:hypothetical protein